MRKVKEVLRPRFGLGLQQNQVARSCSIGQATFTVTYKRVPRRFRPKHRQWVYGGGNGDQARSVNRG